MAIASDITPLAKCCVNYSQYPIQLVQTDIYQRVLQSFLLRLTSLARCLFCDPDQAYLEFWDLYKGARKFELSGTENLADVQQLCSLPSISDPGDLSKCLQTRFIFLYSQDSKSQLYTTRDMLTFALSYHQVQPWFLDFLFAFGEQATTQDFKFSSFRHKNRLQDKDCGLNLPQISRSGQDFHLCYNLKAAEPDDVSEFQPWSVRQIVVYHSFDVQTGQSFWIVLKGNASMIEDVTAQTAKMKWRDDDGNEAQSPKLAFASSLSTHLLFCEWSRENWRWYINDLEKDVDDITQQGIDEKVSSPSALQLPIMRRQTTMGVVSEKPTFARARKAVSSIANKASRRLSSTFKKQPQVTVNEVPARAGGQVGATAPVATNPFEDRSQKFTMGDLQDAQFIEEKVNRALLALRSNIKNLTALRAHYKGLENVDGVADLASNCLADFMAQIDEIIGDLDMYQSTLDALARQIEARKNLLFAIMEYRNMEASQLFARHAHESARNMEEMTEEMQELTRQTKRETSSMKIITLVTMFFLPGTFMTTLMSTDILQWQYDSATATFQKLVSTDAIKTFVAFTVPATLGVFLIWTVIHASILRKEKQDEQRRIERKSQAGP